MASFKGSEVFSLDNKGRVSVPSKMCKCIPLEAANTFTVTRGLDQCIFAYPLNIWTEKIEPRYEALDQYDETHRFMLRKMFEWCKDIELDGSQKLLLPKELLAFAKIEEKVKIIGVADHIELWNPEIYEQYSNSDSRSYEEIAKWVMSGSINNEKAKEEK